MSDPLMIENHKKPDIGLSDWQLRNLSGFTLQLWKRFYALFRPSTANAKSAGDNPAGKFNHAFKTSLVLASGTEWVRDFQGDWHLLKANGIEKQTAVLELFEHLWGPVGMCIQGGSNQCLYRLRLAEFFEMGLRLPVKRFQCPCQTKATQGNETSLPGCHDCGEKAEYGNGKQAANGSDGIGGTG